MSVRQGDRVAGKYRIDRILGEGAMGVVAAATHVELGKPVAVKFMKLDVIPGKDGIERFMREARAAARLQTEHICHVHDVGKLEDGTPFIVMELLDGDDLAHLFARSGVLPQHVVANYVLQVCEAMAEAHAVGIVHRDLKPQNLFVTKTKTGAERIKVLDFGVSKVTVGGDNLKTRTATVMGTPAYMSPEQLASSKDVDGRADIWSIGVILYELATGQLPFAAPDFLALAIQIAQQTPLSPRVLNPALDPEFEAVIVRCLAKDRDLRYADATELVHALQPFALPGGAVVTSGLAFAATAAPAKSATVSSPGSQTTLGGASGQLAIPPRSRTPLLVGGASAIVAFAALAIVLVTRTGDDGARTIAPAAPPSLTEDARPAALSTTPPSEAAIPLPIDPAKVPKTSAEPLKSAEPPTAVEPSKKVAVPAPIKKAEPSGPKRETTVNVDRLTVDTLKAKEIEAKRIEAERIKAEQVKAGEIKADHIETKDAKTKRLEDAAKALEK